MHLENLGLVGNCQFSALINRCGDVVFCCLPRFDSDPVFAALLDEESGGRMSVGPAGGGEGSQRYLPNTNVLETVFETPEGRFRVVDFAPRFALQHSHFRPTELHRIIEPLDGAPRVRVRLDPRLGWTRNRAPRVAATQHLDFLGYDAPLRLTTDVPISYLDGQPFALTAPRHLVLSWGAAPEGPVATVSRGYLDETVRYWQTWVKRCNIPPRYQTEVIRSALALKLHCFEDTGAIVAAMTTSIPESPGSGRTWDYRYCWLRDAYYVLASLRLLGHFEERERFTQFLLDVAGGAPDLSLAPLYRIDGKSDLDERTLGDWAGYYGEKPVRVGNSAATHLQHDVYGEAVLALAPIFLDERFGDERAVSTLDLLEALAKKAARLAGTPDAGIWEYRTEWQPQTFSSLMCWAANDRVAQIVKLHRPSRVDEFAAAATRIRGDIIERAFNSRLRSFVATYGGEALDASLLQLVTLRFLPSDDGRLASTVDAIQAGLGKDGWLQRYINDDGFGRPEVAFTICTFWLVEALAHVGRTGEARAVLDRSLAALSPLGLVAEDYDPVTKRMWVNFPQAYSHVGLIHAAFAASPRWADWL